MRIKDALKYTTTDINALLPNLEAGGEHAKPRATHRLIAADAFQEAGRHAESRLLRSGLPIYVHQGKVYHAKGAHRPEDLQAFVSGYLDKAATSKVGGSGAEHDEDSTYLAEHIHPESRKAMTADATHFFHSMYPHTLEENLREGTGMTLWTARNLTPEEADQTPFVRYDPVTNQPELVKGERSLRKTAAKMGSYRMVPNDDPLTRRRHPIKGEQVGKPQKWGQPEGIPE